MSPSRSPRSGVYGRPVVTSHAAIEQAAFRLFAECGFDATTLADIARELGVGRRTLLRYFKSKNDIPWGRFDDTLDEFRGILDAMGHDIPLWEAVHRGVMQFNDFPPDVKPTHEQRMRLILETPALQAHSALRYADWRQVIAEYVAKRLDCSSADLLPQTVGHVSLALALSAYAAWMDDPRKPLLELLDQSMRQLRWYFDRS